jgi:hypothetical protein
MCSSFLGALESNNKNSPGHCVEIAVHLCPKNALDISSHVSWIERIAVTGKIPGMLVGMRLVKTL